jgi:hypothetical protein
MKYNYPRPHRKKNILTPRGRRLHRALMTERAYISGIQRSNNFLRNALEYATGFISLLVGDHK